MKNIFLIFALWTSHLAVGTVETWHYSQPIDIYESSSVNSGYIVAGAGSNYAKGAELEVFDIKTKTLQSSIRVPDPIGAIGQSVFGYVSQTDDGVVTISVQKFGDPKALWTIPVPGK
jgi:hypothetical protein